MIVVRTSFRTGELAYEDYFCVPWYKYLEYLNILEYYTFVPFEIRIHFRSCRAMCEVLGRHPRLRLIELGQLLAPHAGALLV